MAFQTQFFEDEDIVVYQGGITRFKFIRSLIEMLDSEPDAFELRHATQEEIERYAKNL